MLKVWQSEILFCNSPRHPAPPIRRYNTCCWRTCLLPWVIVSCLLSYLPQEPPQSLLETITPASYSLVVLAWNAGGRMVMVSWGPAMCWTGSVLLQSRASQQVGVEWSRPYSLWYLQGKYGPSKSVFAQVFPKTWKHTTILEAATLPKFWMIDDVSLLSFRTDWSFFGTFRFDICRPRSVS